jgi:D-alanyl-D-alanine carboxypeptidase
MTIHADFDVIPPAVKNTLDTVAAQNRAAKARALVTTAEGSPLVSWGEVNLPNVVMGVTKLFTLAMILREFDRGAMTPETPIIDVLPEDTISGLCMIKRKDRSELITVEHLMSHRSGINDYFYATSNRVLSLQDQTLARDRNWSSLQALEIARHYPGRFTPGAKGKMHYSHTNYLLLGEILQESTGMSFEQLVNLRIISPLGLTNTFVFNSQTFDRYFTITPVMRGNTALRYPQTLASFGAVGSLISTSTDMVRFLRGFSSGELFHASWMTELVRHPLGFKRGISFSRGVMIMPHSRKTPPIIGLSGSSGATALMNTANGDVGFMTSNTLGARGNTATALAKVMKTIASAPRMTEL